MRPRLLHLGYMANVTPIETAAASFNEAEAFTPRILPALCITNPVVGASMRPRLLHLGYKPATDNHGQTVCASMRPRLLHLGYDRLGVGKAERPTRFNEAEAFTPRIPPQVLKANEDIPQSFNEAEAFTPRIPLAVLESRQDAAVLQ